MESSEFEELISYLKSTNKELRYQSVIVFSTYCTNLSLNEIRELNIICIIKPLLSDYHNIAHIAYKTLINLVADKDELFIDLISIDIISIIFDCLLDKDQLPLHEVTSLLIANLSHHIIFCEKLFDDITTIKGYYFIKLLEKFCIPVTSNDHYQFIANAITNISQLEIGRSVLLSPPTYYISTLLSQLLESNNSIRKYGIVRSIYNCVLHKELLKTLMDPPIDIFSFILLPLCGGQPFQENEEKCLPTKVRLYRQFLQDHQEEAYNDHENVRITVLDILYQYAIHNYHDHLKNIQVLPLLINLKEFETNEKFIKKNEELIGKLTTF